MPPIDWPAVHATRQRIEALEADLATAYEQRRSLVQMMHTAAGMGQREIGAYWNLSQPRISAIINGAPRGRFGRGERGAGTRPGPAVQTSR